MPLGRPPLPRLSVASLQAFGENSEQVAERPEVEIEVTPVEPEVLGQLVHALLELHERLAETLDLLVALVPRRHAAERLRAHQLPEQLDEGEHELCVPALDVLRIGLDAARQRAACSFEVACESLEIAACKEELVGG